MHGVKSSTLLLVFLLNGFVLLAASSFDSDSSLSDLYENLLQREYTGPISFPNHQVERKAQRSPSLRLRFGRRSDPSMSLYEKRFSDEINQKPIRSPSLRLRFGKRDPSISQFGDEYSSNEMDIRRDVRVPSTRLRWGRRNDPSVSFADNSNLNELDVQPEKRKPVRLRWGRSYKTGAADFNTNTEDLNNFLTDHETGLSAAVSSQTSSDNLNRLEN